MRFVNYDYEQELANFEALLHTAIDNVKKNTTQKFDYISAPDNTTPVLHFERNCAGTPAHNCALGFHLKFNKQDKTNDNFWIGKIIWSPENYNIIIWFPLKDKTKNGAWYKKLTDKTLVPLFFEVWQQTNDHAHIVLKEPYRSDFFCDTGNGMTGLSKLAILEKFIDEVIKCA